MFKWVLIVDLNPGPSHSRWQNPSKIEHFIRGVVLTTLGQLQAFYFIVGGRWPIAAEEFIGPLTCFLCCWGSAPPPDPGLVRRVSGGGADLVADHLNIWALNLRSCPSKPFSTQGYRTPACSAHLPITGERRDRFLFFLRVLVRK